MQQSLLKKLVQFASSTYAHTLGGRILDRDGANTPTASKFANDLKQFKDSISHEAVVSALETLTQEHEGA